MKRSLRFCKVVGAGNDFILVDARRRPFEASAPQTARRWCNRTQGIGADGLLLVLPAQGSDARMRIFNPDGSEASMCGNGLRCVAWYLASTTEDGLLLGPSEVVRPPIAATTTEDGLLGPSEVVRPPIAAATNGKAQSFSIQTGAGVLKAQVVGKERVRIFLSTPRQWRLHLKLSIRGKPFTVHSVNTGVPHAVVLVKRLDEIDLAQSGSEVRHHRLFKPAGTNVNLVRIDSPRQISIRTYERGVEAETLACGTGAVACAVISAALGYTRPPVVQVKTASGEFLTVGFSDPARQPECPPLKWQNLSLEGPARILFQGEIPL